ncbi:hypothetical protein DP144_12795 [Clostridium tetani]|nr:hypothetical protein KY55_08460 [Clostridium tetani]RXI67787.1 hypothetical protein DP127_14010 [Clostridium tetani]RXM56730.1 hypothetical protein DP133_13500 [Clostridium tetani]RXM74239.1 hypothetical protein DP154_12900 [Clostridium tetani]RYU98027.1 hypothetical protein DP144_12795 [Clostridium tetani]
MEYRFIKILVKTLFIYTLVIFSLVVLFSCDFSDKNEHLIEDEYLIKSEEFKKIWIKLFLHIL